MSLLFRLGRVMIWRFQCLCRGRSLFKYSGRSFSRVPCVICIPRGTSSVVGVMFAIVLCIFGAVREGTRFVSLTITMEGCRCCDCMDRGRAWRIFKAVEFT